MMGKLTPSTRGCASITIEPTPGRSIESVSAKACQVAAQLGLDVHFKFNGVKCIALPGGDPKILQANWQAELRAKRPYPIATTHPRADDSSDALATALDTGEHR